MDYGHLDRGTCSSSGDVCVPQNKTIEGNVAFMEMNQKMHLHLVVKQLLLYIFFVYLFQNCYH